MEANHHMKFQHEQSWQIKIPSAFAIDPTKQFLESATIFREQSQQMSADLALVTWHSGQQDDEFRYVSLWRLGALVRRGG